MKLTQQVICAETVAPTDYALDAGAETGLGPSHLQERVQEKAGFDNERGGIA